MESSPIYPKSIYNHVYHQYEKGLLENAIDGTSYYCTSPPHVYSSLQDYVSNENCAYYIVGTYMCEHPTTRYRDQHLSFPQKSPFLFFFFGFLSLYRLQSPRSVSCQGGPWVQKKSEKLRQPDFSSQNLAHFFIFIEVLPPERVKYSSPTHCRFFLYFILHFLESTPLLHTSSSRIKTTNLVALIVDNYVHK